MAVPESNEALAFALEGTKTGITSWGHEYLRTLGGEIASEYKKRVEKGGDTELKDIQFLIDSIIPYNMTHNAEPEAVDMLLEISRLPLLIDVPLALLTLLYSCAASITTNEFASIFLVATHMRQMQRNMKLD